MDFELPEASHQRILRLSIYSALAALAVIGIVVGLAHLQPAARTFLDQAAHIAKRLDGRIVFALGVGGAKFARKNARGRDCTKQRDNHG